MSLPRCKHCPQCDCCGNSRDTETYGCSCPPCICPDVVRKCPPPPPRKGICEGGCRVGLPPSRIPDSIENIGKAVGTPDNIASFAPGITPVFAPGITPILAPGITPIFAPSITPILASRPEGLTDPVGSRTFTPSITPLYSFFVENENLILGGLALITIIIMIIMFKKFY